MWAGGHRGAGGGLILAKQGAADNFPALWVTLMHMTATTVTLWLVTALRGQIREALGRFAADRSAWGSTVAGSFLGPFLGVTLSIVAIQHIAVEIASTLMALPSVCPLPLCALMFGERIGWQAVLGTGVAMVGMTLLCLDG